MPMNMAPCAEEWFFNEMTAMKRLTCKAMHRNGQASVQSSCRKGIRQCQSDPEKWYGLFSTTIYRVVSMVVNIH